MHQETMLTIYQEKYPHLKSIVLRYLGSQSPDIDDVLQGAFIKAWCGAETLREENCVKAWLTRIVCNECITYLRKRAH